jgi:hypothetical protein
MRTKLTFITIALMRFLCPSISAAQINPSDNLISVDVSTYPQNTSFNYDSCFARGVNSGIRSTGIYQNWTAIETSPDTFNLTIFDIADYYYAAQDMPVDLTLAPIHTNNLEVPSDLRDVAFDNPVLINRFKTLLDSIRKHTPNLKLSSLVIGSEHDVYLGSDKILWSQYTTFYNSVSAYAKTIWPGLKVATELTFNGITTHNDFAKTLNTNSDYIGVSYYPLNSDFTVKPVTTIPADFATLVNLYQSRPIIFYQYGYPSSPTCNSSEALQAQFISQTFATWDIYAANVKMIDFTWLHDLDPVLVNYYSSYYGITDTRFLEFLRTIGLRTWNGNGTDKAAFSEFQCQARQRGFNNLNINCPAVTSVSETSNEVQISIFPNPAGNTVNIELPVDIKNAEVKIYNLSGKAEKIISDINSSNLSIEINDLSDGLYFIELKNGESRINKKITVTK